MKVILIMTSVITAILPIYGQSTDTTPQTFNSPDGNSETVCCASMTVSPTRGDELNYTLSNEVLEYTIFFENNTEDVIDTVVIRDTIHENLDIFKFRPIKASHDLSTLINIPKGYVEFTLADINLQPKQISHTGSQGFVTFTIQPKKGLPEESIATNKATVYFDHKPTFCTNTTMNTIVSQLPPVTSSRIRDNIVGATIIPSQNPFFDDLFFTVALEQPRKLKLSFFNLSGQQLYSNFLNLSAGKHRLPIPNELVRNRGTYFYRLEDNTSYITGKVIKLIDN